VKCVKDLDKERKLMTRAWAKRESQLISAIDSTMGMHGDLQGIAGQAMPEIDNLDIPLLDGPEQSAAKDFCNIWILAQAYGFKCDRLAQAITATFARRRTEIPTERPGGLTSAFASDPTKQQQWNGFVEEVAINPGPLVDVVEALAYLLKTTAHLNSPRPMQTGKKVRRTSRA